MEEEWRASAPDRVASRDGVGSASRTPYAATAQGQARLCRRPSLHAYLHQGRQHVADAHSGINALLLRVTLIRESQFIGGGSPAIITLDDKKGWALISKAATSTTRVRSKTSRYFPAAVW